MENNEYQYEEMDLLEIMKLLIRKWYIILIFVILGGVASYFYLDNHEPEYISESSLIVELGSSDSEYTDVLLAQRLTSTYSQIIYSDNVLSTVSKGLTKEYSVADLEDIIKVNVVSDSLVIKVSATTNSAFDSYEIVDSTVNQVLELSGEFTLLDRLYQLDEATINNTPVGVNELLYYAIGIILGGFISLMVILGVEFTNTKIKTEDDVKKYLGQKVLITIPYYKSIK